MTKRVARELVNNVRIAVGVLALMPVVFMLIVTLFDALKLTYIQDDYSAVLESERYSAPVQAASDEEALNKLLAKWKNVNATYDADWESALQAHLNGLIPFDFLKELNPGYRQTVKIGLRNSEMLSMVYRILEDGNPVPINFAVRSGDEWIIDYALVIAMDIPDDSVSVADTRGNVEELTIDEFIARTIMVDLENQSLAMRLQIICAIHGRNALYMYEPLYRDGN